MCLDAYTLSTRLIPEVYAFWIARAYLHGKAPSKATRTQAEFLLQLHDADSSDAAVSANVTDTRSMSEIHCGH